VQDVKRRRAGYCCDQFQTLVDRPGQDDLNFKKPRKMLDLLKTLPLECDI